MVSTRRPARRRESESSVPAAGAQAELTSMEGSTSVKPTKSRSKSNAHSEVTSDSGSEKMKESETKSGVEEPLETQKNLNRSKALHLADSVAELQADGDISEAESNCSSVSGLQTPMFIRITRRRKIMVPCQPESVAKNRQSKKVLPNEGGKNQDEDISEAESCSSTVSGVRTINTPRKSRSQQIKASVLSVCETHTEEVSDAESWCSGVSSEPSAQFKRITRSMRVKSKVETTCQSEKKSEVVLADEKLRECATKSLPIVISDSEQPTKSDSETEKASFSSAPNNEHPSPCKTKRHFESVISMDSKQILQSTPKKMERECTQKSSKKQSPKDKNYKSCIDYNAKPPKTGTKRATQSCFHHTEEVIEIDKVPAASPQNSNIQIQTVESSHDDCRISFASEDSDGSQEEPVAETSSDATKKVVNEKSFFASLFISSDSESENSDLEEINDMKVIASSPGTSSKNALALDTSDQEQLFVIDKTPCTSIKNASALDASNQEELFVIDKTPGTSIKNASALDASNQELFVIDKTPGLDSSKAYYLEKDLVDDKESETSKESSELEVDEDEEDEDEDLLASKNKLGLFSSSIDPGLNIEELGGLYINFDVGKPKPASHGTVPLKEKKKDELLQKSVITPDFEKKECVPQKASTHQLKKQRRAEREKTTGDGWFGMKAPEMTEELKNDLQALKMRAAMDPKRFYKKNDRKGLPKYFQVGTIVDSPVDFYHARIPKKERKKTIVEELLADSEFRRYNKRKYQDIMAEKAALATGKKKMKKKKFHK